MIFYEHTVNSA